MNAVSRENLTVVFRTDRGGPASAPLGGWRRCGVASARPSSSPNRRSRTTPRGSRRGRAQASLRPSRTDSEDPLRCRRCTNDPDRPALPAPPESRTSPLEGASRGRQAPARGGRDAGARNRLARGGFACRLTISNNRRSVTILALRSDARRHSIEPLGDGSQFSHSVWGDRVRAGRRPHAAVRIRRLGTAGGTRRAAHAAPGPRRAAPAVPRRDRRRGARRAPPARDGGLRAGAAVRRCASGGRRVRGSDRAARHQFPAIAGRAIRGVQRAESATSSRPPRRR